MKSMHPLVMGYPLDVLLMLVSGVFYLVCALYVLKIKKEDRSELVNALFAFLTYQAVGMFFMGLQMNTMEAVYGRIAALSVLIGAAYMLKFPFSRFSASTRKITFMLSLIVSFLIFGWFIQNPMREMKLFHFMLWYDIVVNGLVVGGAIILFGLRNSGFYRTKALGGGSGVVSCCVVANVSMLGGFMLVSSFFQFLAPVLILAVLIMGKKGSSQSV